MDLPRLEDERRPTERVSSDWFGALVGAVPSAVLAVDGDGWIVAHNRRAARLFGYDPGGMVGRSVAEFLSTGVRDPLHRAMARRRSGAVSEPLAGARDLSACRRDGTEFAADVLLVPAVAPEGPIVAAIVVDTSERRREEEDAQRRARLGAAVAQLTAAALGGADREQLMIRAVEAVRDALGTGRTSVLELGGDTESPTLAVATGWPERLVGKPLKGATVTGDDPPRLAGLTRFGVGSSAAAWIGFGGRRVAVLAAHEDTSRTFSEDDRQFIVSAANVLAHAFARAELERRLRDEALHDPLTGLANRALFLERLDHWLARQSRLPERAAVIFLDLDGFKAINDSRGHAVGDEILKLVAQRLLQTVRAGTTVARLGGDEFALLLEGLDAGWGARTVARRLEEAFRKPFQVADSSIVLTASMGISTPGVGAHTSERIVRNADNAMYAAKRDGGARVRLFDRGMHEASVRRLRLERQLRDAVGQNDFEVLYQPVVRLEDERLAGFEALVRWRRDGQLIPPAKFLPIAEETSLIVQVGSRVIDMVCAQAAEWQERFPDHPGTRVSVNLSTRQIVTGFVVDHVADALRKSGLKPQRLGLEVDESALIDDGGIQAETLRRLRGLGVEIVLDRFGLRYGALSWLPRSGIDLIKIDRSCVQDIDRRVDRRALVSGIVSTAAALKIDVVAEGVERNAESEAVRAIGCRFAQGYHFARPLDVAYATRALRARSLRRLKPPAPTMDGFVR